jgi:hypothetical protein
MLCPAIMLANDPAICLGSAPHSTWRLQIRGSVVETAGMRHSKLGFRGALFFGYFVLTAVVLFVFSAGDTFCARPGGPNHEVTTLKLAVALSVLDFAASMIVALAPSASLPASVLRWIAPITAALLVGAVCASLPIWIYRGYGHFCFENTWADVSCFFAEGYGLSFMFFVAPILALATFLREAIVLHFQTRPRTQTT